MRVRLADLIASETHGVSYKTLRYGLDALDSPNSYEVSAVWEHSAESSHKPKYIDLYRFSTPQQKFSPLH